MGKVAVTGNADRLRLLGFQPTPEPVAAPEPEPEEEEELGEPLLKSLGLANASVEEKAKAITEAWLNGLTERDIRKLGATGADKVAKIAGIGGAKKPDPSSNPVIMAIIIALQNLGVKPPELKVIEQDTLEAK